MSVPRKQRKLERFALGLGSEGGGRAVTEAEIIERAQCFQRQSIHFDPAQATPTSPDDIVAGDSKSRSRTIPLMVGHELSIAPSVGSRFVDAIRCLRPPRYADRLRGHVSILSAGRAIDRRDWHGVRLLRDPIHPYGEAAMIPRGRGIVRYRS